MRGVGGWDVKVWRCGYGGGWGRCGRMGCGGMEVWGMGVGGGGVGGWDVKVWRCGYGGGWGRCGRMGCEGMEVWG